MLAIPLVAQHSVPVCGLNSARRSRVGGDAVEPLRWGHRLWLSYDPAGAQWQFVEKRAAVVRSFGWNLALMAFR
jgi:hypothetical protein